MLKFIVFKVFILSAVIVKCEAEVILKRDLPILFNQTKLLSQDVCTDLFPDENQTYICQKKFLSPSRTITTPTPPRLTLKCQSTKSITFVRSPHEGWQLVVLIPQEKDFVRVSYTILESTETVGQLYTTPQRNYELWTTTLDSDGGPSLWLRGPDVGVWVTPPPVKYDIDTLMLLHEYKKGTQKIPAEFTWNGDDESDSCFEVINKCNSDIQGDFFAKSIPPDSDRSVMIEGLPLGDACMFRLTGKYGTTQIKYRTPDCYDIEGCVPLPEKFSNVSVNITETYSGEWRVRVSWNSPRVTPVTYNATLYADTVYNKLISGNATEVTFEDVSGEGQYTVSLASTTASGTAHTSRTGSFPILEKISNLSMEISEEESGGGWRVRVRWARPRTTAVQYNATLYADTAYNVVIPGNNTEVMFEDISGDGMFNVSLVSTSATGTAFTSSQGYFPSERFSNMSVEVSEAQSGAGWRVRVRWPRARDSPLQYNATLCADTAYSVILPGNSTEVLFEEIFSEGLFNVTLVATMSTGKQLYARRQGYLPRLAHTLSVGLLVSAAWLTALVFVVALSVLVYFKKKRSEKDKFEYFQGLKDKLYKDSALEIIPEVVAEDTWEVEASLLVLHELVGEGAFGLVRRATLAPGKEVAVKMLKEFPSAEEVRSFRAEMELMKSVGSHAHIVSLVGCCSGRHPLIIVEYCSRGDLLTFLRHSWDVMLTKRNARYYNTKDNIEHRTSLFKENYHDQSTAVVNKLYELRDVCEELTFLDLLSFCRQIAMGMEFLASNRVVHRDLAARNVLVTGDKTLKIADFGLSRDVYQENQYKQKGNGKLPVKWMALESLTHRIFTTHSDVWSFGVVMWEVVSLGGAPYPAVAAARLPRLLRTGYRMPRPCNCTPQLYEVMMCCWRARPCERPTFAQLRARLDALLSTAAADRYLALDLPADVAPPPTLPALRALPAAPVAPARTTPPLDRNSLLSVKEWERGENYERPNALSNHYTSPPASQPATQFASQPASQPATQPATQPP